MKVVLGVHHYPPAFTGGVELLAQRMARWLVEHGHSVEVVCVESIQGRSELSVRSDWEDGVRVHRLELDIPDGQEPLTMRFRDPVIEAWCAEYFQRERPDIFHSLSSYVLTASAIDAARNVGIPTVVGLDDYWYFCPRMSFLRTDGGRCRESASPADCAWCVMRERRRYRWMDRLSHSSRRLLLDNSLVARVEDRQNYLEDVLAQANAIVTPAPLVRDLLVSRERLSDKVRLIPHGLDAATPREAPRLPRGNTLRIGYLGQIVPAKGVHVLIDAVKQLDELGDSVELQIHGDCTRFPDYAAKLHRMAGGDPRIQFRGAYRHEDVAGVLADVDVLVFPSSWYEILGIVILEAFQAGIPVIASHLPNHAYHIHDEVDGLLFEADDAGDLARQLRRLVDEPDLLQRLASNIRSVPTFEAEMGELETLYGEVSSPVRQGVGAHA